MRAGGVELGSGNELDLIIGGTGDPQTITPELQLAGSYAAVGFDLHDPGNPDGNNPCCDDQAIIRINGIDVALGDLIDPVSDGGGYLQSSVGWVGFILTDGTFDTLLFHNNGGGTQGFTIDNIRVATVVTPLPAALPLYGTGLGLMGLFGWWRRRRAATT